MSATPPEFVARINQLRDNLDFNYKQIAEASHRAAVQPAGSHHCSAVGMALADGRARQAKKPTKLIPASE